MELSRVDCGRLQLDRVAAIGAVQCLLEVAALGHRDHLAWSRRVSHIGLDINPWKLSRTVEIAADRRRDLQGQIATDSRCVRIGYGSREAKVPAVRSCA